MPAAVVKKKAKKPRDYAPASGYLAIPKEDPGDKSRSFWGASRPSIVETYGIMADSFVFIRYTKTSLVTPGGGA